SAFKTNIFTLSPSGADRPCFPKIHMLAELAPSSCARSTSHNVGRGVKNTVAQRNTNTAAAPVHSQKPRCQNTECRRALRIGIAQEGFSCVSRSRDSLKKIPHKSNSVTKDEVKNKGTSKRPREQAFQAHQPQN